MADKFSTQKRSRIMSNIRNKDSLMELQLRKFFWSKGYRYMKNSPKHFGKPDLVFSRQKIVIFVDSCFWHGCKSHGSIPNTRREFWMEKINRNKLRDELVTSHYLNEGWNIFRIWEHDIKKTLKRH